VRLSHLLRVCSRATTAAYGLGFNLGVEGTLEKARKEYVPSLVACWQIWFPASVRRLRATTLTDKRKGATKQFVAFSFPVAHQAVIMAVVRFFLG